MHQVVAGGLGPGQDVKVFVRLHAGQGRAHDVAGIVSAAAHGDDAGVQAALHDVVDGIGLQVMQLDGLAGGEVDAAHLVAADRVGGKGQFFRGDPAGGHAQAQHVGFAAPLGVAAVQAGKAFVSHFVKIAGVKIFGFLPKSGKVLFPGPGIDGLGCSHKTASLSVS